MDWARARLGSPLEAVSSWLQSLGFWEPEVRRSHETLLRYYLAMCGHLTQLDRRLRQRYWLAGACNGLAGALRQHLSVAVDAANRQLRRYANALAALHDWLCIIRHADACQHC